jgi:hypothetical protein
MIKLNNLKYPPIKNYGGRGKLPDSLVFASKIKFMDAYIDKFVLISTKGNKGEHAIMKCFPEQIDREGKTIKSLYVWTLKSSKSGLGLGSRLLNFAKIHSQRIGLNGNFHLISSSERSPERIPHIFYKKFGMNTDCQSINNRLDKFIKEGKTATIEDFSSIRMFYPPIHFEPSGFEKMIAKVKKFIN